MKRVLTIVQLALADCRNDALLTACGILALAAVTLPLLVIIGVQQGLVGALSDRLLADPRNLEIRPAGMGQYNLDWIERLRSDPDVAFVIPQTRSISAQLELFPNALKESSGRAVKVDLLPSGPDDPLLKHWEETSRGGPSQSGHIVLSSSAARKLGVNAPGEELRGRVSRRLQGAYEQEFFPLLVQGILPLEADQRDAAYVTLELLENVENYRDGRAVPALGWGGDSPTAPRRTYLSFRLYARSLDGVERLNALLLANGIETYTRAEEIAAVKSLDRAFSFLSILLLLVVGGGFLASAVSSALAQVGRKQRSLGVLRLLGFKSFHLALFPLVQAAVSGICGSLLALGLFYFVQGII
ncbi:MAG: ABC transporter permease, partial [Desulfovibrionaceae bacterium]|nr:ABC transporter permease [Desulfovibrionaceae bacterium]